jgi:hypothetical protein
MEISELDIGRQRHIGQVQPVYHAADQFPGEVTQHPHFIIECREVEYSNEPWADEFTEIGQANHQLAGLDRRACVASLG